MVKKCGRPANPWTSLWKVGGKTPIWIISENIYIDLKLKTVIEKFYHFIKLGFTVV